MFIQVIQGEVADAEALRTAVQGWRERVAPQVPGWLGTTAGVTADGRSIAVVRFASLADAQRNNERAEQQQWWAQTSALFTGEVTFHDCAEQFSFFGGGSDDAGFVQVIQGTSPDPGRLRELMDSSSEDMRRLRPDVLGGTVALHGDGGFTQVVYFASEAAARAGESGEDTTDMAERNAEMGSLLRDLTFFDLPDPWLHSPA